MREAKIRHGENISYFTKLKILPNIFIDDFQVIGLENVL